MRRRQDREGTAAVKILVIGYNAFDVIVPVAGLPRADTKHEVADIRLGGGGPGATAAIALARLGAEVQFLTVFGDDLPASWQRAELADAGVDTAGSVTATGHRSPRAVSLADLATEERTILWTRGTLPPFPAASIRESWLDGVRLLYADSHEPAAALILAREARRRGLPVVVDAGSVRPGMRELVAASSDVIGSAGFAPKLTGTADPADALRRLRALGPPRVATTFGPAGCLALDDDEMIHVPAFAVAVRDTTGAGDAFHAGYAFGIASGHGFRASLRLGAAVAALKCRGWGGRSTLPDLARAAAFVEAAPVRAERPPGWTR
jgi:ribokinase